MVLLQPKLSLKVAQRQILTPGLMQMVSVLALNKLELKEMLNAEIVENPVLEELEENVPLLDDIAGREADRDRSAQENQDQQDQSEQARKDPFDEIDFGSYFQNYLDPGFRSPGSFELSEKPSFENFLSQPGTLSDHLLWQLGSLALPPLLREAAEYVIGNLNEDGYLLADDEELLLGFLRELRGSESVLPGVDSSGDSLRLDSGILGSGVPDSGIGEPLVASVPPVAGASELVALPESERGSQSGSETKSESESSFQSGIHPAVDGAATENDGSRTNGPSNGRPAVFPSGHGQAKAANLLATAVKLVQELDPPGVATRDLRDCLLVQIEAQRREFQLSLDRRQASHAGEGAPQETAPETRQNVPAGEEEGADHEEKGQIFDLASRIVDQHLSMLQKKDTRELSKALSKPADAIQRAIDFIRTLDPRPGQRYNRSDARLIEPDVAFVKRGEEYVVVMNEEDLPTLRLNQGYRKLLSQDGVEKDVKDYVKERYRSALQLMRNIDQRKNTILRTCEAIVGRQVDFLERGVDAIKPMMIKDVAEEIGVHPSTVSRAVSGKYVHTSQGVFELRFFFSEGVNGPEGNSTPLMLLKRKVKKLIDEEDPRKPLTDDLIASMLQAQGIEVTRRTVAKYREDLRIPSTHQRRVRE